MILTKDTKEIEAMNQQLRQKPNGICACILDIIKRLPPPGPPAPGLPDRAGPPRPDSAQPAAPAVLVSDDVSAAQDDEARAADTAVEDVAGAPAAEARESGEIATASGAEGRADESADQIQAADLAAEASAAEGAGGGLNPEPVTRQPVIEAKEAAAGFSVEAAVAAGEIHNKAQRSSKSKAPRMLERMRQRHSQRLHQRQPQRQRQRLLRQRLRQRV